MRLRSLRIGQFRNLKDFVISFDDVSPYTVLIGSNGAGKSNLIEALSWIFRNLDLGRSAPFDYEIEYECRGHELRITAVSGKNPQFAIRRPEMDGYARLSTSEFMEDDGAPLYRPAFVFGYYSGPSDRLDRIYHDHQDRFYKEIIKDRSDGTKGPRKSNDLRRLFYALTLHGQFALIAFFMGNDEQAHNDRSFIAEHLGIVGLDSVLFSLVKPPWAKENRDGGDSRFWNAVGEVQKFLAHLNDRALLPLGLRGSSKRMNDRLYLFLQGEDDLRAVYEHYGNQYDFFTALESMYLSKVLDGVYTRIKIKAGDAHSDVTYRDLSEGEQQLLLVLGLLKFTARQETLFLLDEPDTHLNPQWSAQYISFLDRFIAGGDSCHVMMSTHDPLVLAGRRASEVRIFTRDAQGVVAAQPPDQDPKGMGVAAILTSDLFGLRSTLDPETQADLDRLRELEAIDELSSIDMEEMRNVRDRLDGKGFQTSHRDPVYQAFLEAWSARERPSWTSGITLSDEERAERAEMARSIVAQLRSQKDV